MLLGNLFISIFLSKFFLGKDIRDVGSGNPGATNMARQNGIGLGLVTLAFDVLKCVLAVCIGNLICGDWGLMFAGLGCIIGHCFPVMHHLAGGKGIAVGVVICFSISWIIGICTVAVFALAAVISKKVSVGSLCSALALIIMCIFMPVSLPFRILGILSALLATYRHKDNIKRLLSGSEPDFVIKK